jgi:hypothetical protein
VEFVVDLRGEEELEVDVGGSDRGSDCYGV